VVVESDPTLTEPLLGTLRGAGWQLFAERVAEASRLADLLDAGGWDLVLAPCSGHTLDGIEVLAVVRARAPDLPVVLAAEPADETHVVTALRLGATVVPADRLWRLAPIVERELAMAALRREHRQTEIALREVSTRLKAAERLEIIGRYEAHIAHDLRGLIAPLVLGADLLARRLPEEDPNNRAASALRRAVRTLVEWIENLGALGRLGRLPRCAVDLNAVVLDAVAHAGILPWVARVRWDLETDLPRVQGATSQIERLVVNLARNAAEAMGHGGGEIVVRTARADGAVARGCEDGGRVLVAIGEDGPTSACPPGAWVLLEVTDAGHGIAPEVAPRLFETFFSTKRGGEGGRAGLGLSIVRAVAIDHGGRVEVESEPGHGATFRVYLPVGGGRG